MANRPIAYTLKERKGIVGNLKGKIVVQAHPTGGKRVDHRSFSDEVAHVTTFTDVEVEAVLRLADEIAKNTLKTETSGHLHLLSKVNWLRRRKRSSTQRFILRNLWYTSHPQRNILHLLA